MLWPSRVSLYTCCLIYTDATRLFLFFFFIKLPVWLLALFCGNYTSGIYCSIMVCCEKVVLNVADVALFLVANIFLWHLHCCCIGCLVNSAQNQLGPILTWPKTNSAQLNNQLGPRYAPTRPKHDSSLFLYYFLPFLAPICLSIRFFSFFHELDYLMASRYKTLEYEWVCLAVHKVWS